jgi:hypothetical protein
MDPAAHKELLQLSGEILEAMPPNGPGPSLVCRLLKLVAKIPVATLQLRNGAR